MTRSSIRKSALTPLMHIALPLMLLISPFAVCSVVLAVPAGRGYNRQRVGALLLWGLAVYAGLGHP